ncbi:hypothetical protein ACFSYD_21605 [Paracoccus aerius]
MTADTDTRGQVALRHLSKAFMLNGQPLPVLRNLSLDIRAGDPWPSSARPAAARPPCCGCWRGWNRPTADRS